MGVSACQPLAAPCHIRVGLWRHHATSAVLSLVFVVPWKLWQNHADLHLSPRMASGVSLPTPGVLRLAAAGVDMSLPTSGNQVSSIWRPLAPGDIMTSEILSMLHNNNVVKLLFAVQTPFALDLLLEVCDADLRSVLRQWDMIEAEGQGCDSPDLPWFGIHP